MFRLGDIPRWYLVIAGFWSLYQAYRGFEFQRILGIQQITGVRRVVLLCLADAFTYLVCTMSGFISLHFFYHLTSQAALANDLAGSALLIS